MITIYTYQLVQSSLLSIYNKTKGADPGISVPASLNGVIFEKNWKALDMSYTIHAYNEGPKSSVV